MKRPLPFTLFVVGLAGMLPALAACPKENPPVTFDAAPPPPPSAEPDEELVPLDAGEDASDADAEVDAGKPKTGSGVTTNQARVLQCCRAIDKQIKTLGASPEAGLLTQASSTCKVVAAQLGRGATGVEMAALRAALAGKTLPAGCAGL